jgi:hypothetical protein
MAWFLCWFLSLLSSPFIASVSNQDLILIASAFGTRGLNNTKGGSRFLVSELMGGYRLTRWERGALIQLEELLTSAELQLADYFHCLEVCAMIPQQWSQ